MLCSLDRLAELRILSIWSNYLIPDHVKALGLANPWQLAKLQLFRVIYSSTIIATNNSRQTLIAIRVGTCQELRRFFSVTSLLLTIFLGAKHYHRLALLIEGAHLADLGRRGWFHCFLLLEHHCRKLAFQPIVNPYPILTSLILLTDKEIPGLEATLFYFIRSLYKIFVHIGTID